MYTLDVYNHVIVRRDNFVELVPVTEVGSNNFINGRHKFPAKVNKHITVYESHIHCVYPTRVAKLIADVTFYDPVYTSSLIQSKTSVYTTKYNLYQQFKAKM